MGVVAVVGRFFFIFQTSSRMACLLKYIHPNLCVPKQFDELKLQECSKAKDSMYLGKVSEFVNENRGRCSSLKKPPGSILRISSLEDTIYRDKPDEVKGWGMFYLPGMVNMKVLGVVEGTSCPSDELVLMTCEDRRLYAYDGEELHIVAPGLLQLDYGEIEYPSVKSYYKGQAFEDLTQEDWAEVKQGDVGRKLDQEHKKLVEKNKPTFLDNLKSQK